MREQSELTSAEKRALWWGRLRRWYRHTFTPGYIARSHARRRGECLRCGACCRLGSRCHHLGSDGDGIGVCDRHEIRPRSCRVFPIDDRDLADRDILAPGTRCGYRFERDGAGEGPSGAGAPAEVPVEDRSRAGA